MSWQMRMVNLTKLDVSNNSMQGQLPGFLNEFTNLKTLLLDRNEFGGPIPALDNLKFLSGKVDDRRDSRATRDKEHTTDSFFVRY